MSRPYYLSRRPVDTNEWSVSVTIGVTTEALTLTAGRYYNDSGTAAESLADELEDTLNTHSALGGNPFTVTYDPGGATFTISRTGVFQIAWSVTTLRDWLGFTGTISGAASYTSDQFAQGTILADTDRAQFKGRQYHYQVSSTPSQAGPVAVISTGVETINASWEHPLEPYPSTGTIALSGARDDDDSVVPWTWLDFYRHHLQLFAGEPFRFFDDVTTAVNAYEDEYQLVDLTAFDPARGEDEVDALWTIRIVAADYVEST